MPKRIYALAKELAMDSKELVDLCTKIGIQNKGSALASLEDDEVDRIEKYLKGGETQRSDAPASSSGAAVAAPPPPVAGPLPARRTGPIPNLVGRASTKTAPPSRTAPEVAAQAAGQMVTGQAAASSVAASQVAEESAAKPAAQAPPPVTPVELPAAEPPKKLTRDDYTPIPVGSGRVRVLDARRSETKKAEGGDERRKQPAQRREPVINLARLPKGSPSPVPAPKSNEPAPQRPEIRFTKDDISGQKQGMKAPLQEMEAQQQEKTESGRGKGGGKSSSQAAQPGAAPAAPGGLKNFKAAADKAKGRYRGDDEEEGGVRGKKGSSGIAAARAERKKRSRSTVEGVDEFARPQRGSRRLVRKGTNTAAPRKDNAVLELPCNVRSFSEAAGVPAGRVLGALMQMGQALTINANVAPELAEMLAAELGIELEFKYPQSLEEGIIDTIDQLVDSDEQLVSRPPIVTFLGHVDHGKTSLLDYLIGTRIVTGEAGGITQCIRAYQVEKDGRIISFVDTPGHEAFTEMRARGANVTDIAVLVIAADDGIMPQTEEAISHAKAAEVPIVVALNKIDLPGVDENRILTQMTEHGLTPSEWGGDVEVVRTSAITGQGMDELLETLLTVAELHDYKANPMRPADGVCLEAEQAADKGVIAKVIVQNGTLKPGDIVLCGSSYGRVKAMYDTLNPSIQMKSAGPTMPVNITGLDVAPGAGDRFYVLENIAQARELAESRSDKSRAQSLSGTSPKVSFETFQDLLQSGKLGKVEDMVELNLIIRADVRGSLEAIEKELSKIDHPEVDIRILQKSVGGITVADVTLASASQAVVVGFNVIPDENARSLADDRNVEIRRYDIIYKLAEDIKAIVEGRLRPEERIIELGRALVKTVFTISRVGAVAGCYVAQGAIERGCRIRVNRDGRTIGDYALDSLKRHKDDVKEVPRGMECGIRLAGFNDLKQDDVLEAYRVEEVARKLE